MNALKQSLLITLAGMLLITSLVACDGEPTSSPESPTIPAPTSTPESRRTAAPTPTLIALETPALGYARTKWRSEIYEWLVDFVARHSPREYGTGEEAAAGEFLYGLLTDMGFTRSIISPSNLKLNVPRLRRTGRS